jgi:hypothetical protein
LEQNDKYGDKFNLGFLTPLKLVPGKLHGSASRLPEERITYLHNSRVLFVPICHHGNTGVNPTLLAEHEIVSLVLSQLPLKDYKRTEAMRPKKKKKDVCF